MEQGSYLLQLIRTLGPPLLALILFNTVAAFFELFLARPFAWGLAFVLLYTIYFIVWKRQKFSEKGFLPKFLLLIFSFGFLLGLFSWGLEKISSGVSFWW